MGELSHGRFRGGEEPHGHCLDGEISAAGVVGTGKAAMRQPGLKMQLPPVSWDGFEERENDGRNERHGLGFIYKQRIMNDM